MPAMATDLTSTPILERTTATYTTTLNDGAGDPLPKASLDSLTVRVFNPYSGDALVGYDSVDGLPFLDDTSGEFVLPLDVVATTKQTSLTLEERWVMLEWAYGSTVGRSFAILGLVAE